MKPTLKPLDQQVIVPRHPNGTLSRSGEAIASAGDTHGPGGVE